MVLLDYLLCQGTGRGQTLRSLIAIKNRRGRYFWRCRRWLEGTRNEFEVKVNAGAGEICGCRDLSNVVGKLCSIDTVRNGALIPMRTNEV